MSCRWCQITRDQKTLTILERDSPIKMFKFVNLLPITMIALSAGINVAAQYIYFLPEELVRQFLKPNPFQL